MDLTVMREDEHEPGGVMAAGEIRGTGTLVGGVAVVEQRHALVAEPPRSLIGGGFRDVMREDEHEPLFM